MRLPVQEFKTQYRTNLDYFCLVDSAQDLKETHCSTFPDMNSKIREMSTRGRDQMSGVHTQCCWLHNKVVDRFYQTKVLL